MRKSFLDNDISVVISTIRPEKTLVLLASLYEQMQNRKDEVIVIFDLSVDLDIKELFNIFQETMTLNIVYNDRNLGLSYNRNLGIELAKNNFVVFFDDDTIIKRDILKRYKKLFSQGYVAIGGPLVLPAFYPELPKWLPSGLSSLFGIHTVQKRIWGGNWGIDARFFKKFNLSFQENLGRKGGCLQSGDESNILEKICAKGGKTTFDTALAIYHCIDKKRYNVTYLIRRAFWQGISEVRKKTILKGIQKDFTRSLQVDHNVAFLLKVLQYLVGLSFFATFLTGVLFELIFLKWRKNA